MFCIFLWNELKLGNYLYTAGGGLNSFKIIVMKIQLLHTYNDIIKLENLLLAWEDFLVGKKEKVDVELFSCDLMDHIVSLHQDLANFTYRHGGYESFFVNDPKRRHIHKALVRDRLLHHAIYRILYPFFDKTFIGDSYSCRLDKGTHKAINHFRSLTYKVSQNHTRTCWILKCDIKKFFNSIDHNILKNILKQYIPDENILKLLEDVIESYSARPPHPCAPLLVKERGGVGLPLGNLTSQLFANIYLNKLDQFIKHKLKARYYIRYADDFVILSHDRQWLVELILKIKDFVQNELSLVLHPDKLFIKTVASGMDFLGWVLFDDHRVLRTKTKKRMFARIEIHPTEGTLRSYLGLVKHGNEHASKSKILQKVALLH